MQVGVYDWTVRNKLNEIYIKSQYLYLAEENEVTVSYWEAIMDGVWLNESDI